MYDDGKEFKLPNYIHGRKFHFTFNGFFHHRLRLTFGGIYLYYTTLLYETWHSNHMLIWEMLLNSAIFLFFDCAPAPYRPSIAQTAKYKIKIISPRTTQWHIGYHFPKLANFRFPLDGASVWRKAPVKMMKNMSHPFY
jgi:hypothetical protein